ncbi:hypothetical protein BB936_22255 (plasmid) [Yersinia enterocolitica]|nr:hypothetical protein BB936_22255 [Yersinia enterocolitica]
MITTESSYRPLKAKQSQQARQKNDRRQRNPFMKIIKSNLKLLQRREIQPICIATRAHTLRREQTL